MLTNDRHRTPLTFTASPFTDRPVFDDYAYAVHPDTGLEVVFCPGEAKPAWFIDAERAAVPPPEPPAPQRGNKAVTADN